MKEVTIYTDGACSGNPGPGGYGAILMYRDIKKEICGGSAETTNNRMEIMAALRALALLKEPCKVSIYTDSAYLCNTFAKGWIYGWQRNGWVTSKKTPVENKDLWMKMLELTRTHEVSFSKVKGHSDNEFNNRCDELARKAITEKLFDDK